MGRYIDAEKIKITTDTMIADGECYVPLAAVKQAIARTQTEDVVKVVRCKDCKHATFYSCKNDACYKGIICEYQIAIGDENFFCACGETRTQKEKDMEK